MAFQMGEDNDDLFNELREMYPETMIPDSVLFPEFMDFGSESQNETPKTVDPRVLQNDFMPNPEELGLNNTVSDSISPSNDATANKAAETNEGTNPSSNVTLDSAATSGNRDTTDDTAPITGLQDLFHPMPGAIPAGDPQPTVEDLVLDHVGGYLRTADQAKAATSNTEFARNDFDHAFKDMESADVFNLSNAVNNIPSESTANLVSPDTTQAAINSGQQSTTGVSNFNSPPQANHQEIPSATQVPTQASDQAIKTSEVTHYQTPASQNTTIESTPNSDFNQQSSIQIPQQPLPGFPQQEEDMESVVADLINRHLPNQTLEPNEEPDLMFNSAEEATTCANRLPLPYDHTIPRTVSEKKAWVKELIKAMRSIRDVEDNENMIIPFRARKHSAVRVEIMAWTLLQICISRHTHGPLLVGFDVKHNKTTSNVPTFRERMLDVLLCLRTCKTICKHLLDPPFPENFVDDPLGARQRVRSNKTLNSKKTKLMNAGKTVLEQNDATPKRGRSKNGGKKDASSSVEPPPTPLATPARLLDAAAPPATPEHNMAVGPPSGYCSPEQQAAVGGMTPETSPSTRSMALNHPAPVNNPTTNSPVHYNTHLMGNSGLPVTLPTNPQLGNSPGYSHTPTVTYPAGRNPHGYSPSKPSGLQKVYQNLDERQIQQQIHQLQQQQIYQQQQQQIYQQHPQQIQNMIPAYQTDFSLPQNIHMGYSNFHQMSPHPQAQGIPVSQAQFNRSSKRPRDDTNGSTGSGSPQKRRRG